jgi:subtilisin family serine protease
MYELDAITYAISKGVLIVASAGNEGTSAFNYPSAYLQPDGGVPSYGLAVGASDAAGNRATYSNYGSRLSLLAPATMSNVCFGVIGDVGGNSGFDHCNPAFADSGTNARYSYGQSTSFAAPEVAGAAALIWAARPELKNYEVANIIKQSASRPAGTGWTPDKAGASSTLAARSNSRPASRAPTRSW